VTIHSFNEVLRASKVIHSVELTPGGGYKFALWRPVPWIALLYFVVVELFFVLAARTPVIGLLYQAFSGLFSPAVYYTVLPFGVVWLAFRVELDGRPPHLWALSYMRYLVRPKRTLGGRAVGPSGKAISYSGRVRIWWDLDAPRLHRGWVRGGRVSTNVPARFTHALRHRHQVLVADDDRLLVLGHEVHGRMQVSA
jgi:hypothetical protein